MTKGKTFIISGPSGVGKSTVLKELFKGREDLYFSISATTRAPREGEQDGVHYHFIDVQHFQELIEADAFLEYAEYVGNFYGTPKKYVDQAMNAGKDVILDIEVQGALQVCNKRPETVRIFIAPPSWDELERRLKSRGTDSEEKIQKRLVRAKAELQTADVYDYFVINDSVEQAVREISAIMLAEHCKPAERMKILSE
ncbi:MAG: guanylate kinase [Ruminococcaceae bacterium]|jgi:guanylate kinase|nr:guanylate kinase [Oscillospiraceae bacterium]